MVKVMVKVVTVVMMMAMATATMMVMVMITTIIIMGTYRNPSCETSSVQFQHLQTCLGFALLSLFLILGQPDMTGKSHILTPNLPSPQQPIFF